MKRRSGDNLLIALCFALLLTIQGLKTKRIHRILETQGDETRRIVVEGSTEPFRFSPNDIDELRAEHYAIIQAIENILNESIRGDLVVEVVRAEENLVNALFIELSVTNDDELVDQQIESIPGVVSVSISTDLQEEDLSIPQQNSNSAGIQNVMDIAQDYLGIRRLGENHCLTGKNVKVAVIDSGIDYTHSVFGGPGTRAAYLSAKDSDSPRSNGLFPTERVVDGKSFLVRNGDNKIDNPIDEESGHGTAVASAIVAMAPSVRLIAAKVCRKGGSCPDYAVIAALDYAFEKGADVVNISLGQPHTNGYYNVLRKVIDNAARFLGMTIVLPAGNYQNLPFILGGIADTANALTVGATTTQPYGSMAFFSSRGPGTLNNLKPDISAPGGSMRLAKAGTGGGLLSARGTSFSCPLVAGAAALIAEKCSSCSAFAIKSILMNNARRNIQGESVWNAPVSWMGSGEVDVGKAASSKLWAYSMDDRQPSIALGAIDVARDMIIEKTIKVTNLLNKSQGLLVRAVFRDPADQQTGALSVSIPTPYFRLQQPCQSSSMVNVEFQIKASKVPSNHMTSGGVGARNTANLEKNEFDGWIVIADGSGNEVIIPFHAFLRKAADVSVSNRLPISFMYPKIFNTQIQNHGTGVAQIDLYELLAISEDDAEIESATQMTAPADFKYIGYRTIPGKDPLCDHVLEFAFTLWERQQTLANIELKVMVDIDGDKNPDFVLSNRNPRRNDDDVSECRVQNTQEGTWLCTDFAPDHATNSGVVILRACANDLGIQPGNAVGVSFSSATYPQFSVEADTTQELEINVPSAISPEYASFNVQPGAEIQSIQLSAVSPIIGQTNTLGLLAITNGYRGPESTGASVTEAIAIPYPRISLPVEKTVDSLSFPKTFFLSGPSCAWDSESSSCPKTRRTQFVPIENRTSDKEGFSFGKEFGRRSLESSCLERPAPRISIVTPDPTSSPTFQPTSIPTWSPSISPTPNPALAPSFGPFNAEGKGAAGLSAIIDSAKVQNGEKNTSSCRQSQLNFVLYYWVPASVFSILIHMM